MQIPGPIRKFLENAVSLTVLCGVFALSTLAITGNLKPAHLLAISYAVFVQYAFIESVKANQAGDQYRFFLYLMAILAGSVLVVQIIISLYP